ncbi:MAG: integration host factor subunit alpha [Bdellovibrio sp.]|nr:integration host factor subunit alpha [Bdellovibrio sp.]
MSLIKAHIIERIYKEAGISRVKATDLVDLVFKLLKDTLSQGEKIKISGFGRFSLLNKGQRLGRDPQTGMPMEISARRVVTFRPSEMLKEDIACRFAHRLDQHGKENTQIPPKDGPTNALRSFMLNTEE